MNVSQIKFPVAVALTGLGLGLIGDLMFYTQPLGISVPILALLVVAALLALATAEKTSVVWANMWLIVPLLFLAAMSAVRAEPLLRFMNVVGALALMLLLANRLATRPVDRLNLGEYIGILFETGLLSLIIAFPLLGRAVKQQDSSAENKQTVRRVIIGLLIALPFLLVFTALFASADLLFNKLVENIVDAINLPDIFGHFFLTLFLAWPIIGGLAYALTRRQEWKLFLKFTEPRPEIEGDEQNEESGEGDAPAAPPRTLRSLLHTVESSTVLFSIDLLFLIFVVIQFAALFGREAFLKSQNLTYSEYARRGFFELLTVSLITLGLVLVIDFITQRETSRQQVIFLAGSGLMIGMTIIILVSAFQRMQLYELAYGFTRLRVYPHVFMVWLALLLVAFLATLLTRRVRLFATAALIACMGFVATLDILNPDVFIVKQNIRRYHNGEELDAAYLGTLSEDAVPYLIPLLHDYGDETQEEIGPWLRSHLDELDERHEKAAWPAYHWSIDRAYRALDAERELIEQYEPY
ncbi:MAG: DUF4173 domain-containing protein, partial [Anaerolineae bacterium]|nr:DUF4173 domain-containing protein [Anaerolineae bacterium]